ncbi:MAG: peptide chain release factor 2 [Verrucomicrobiota bacterium]|nr:peptide chain release factor 2 [Verrucomicrobiota bacterium]
MSAPDFWEDQVQAQKVIADSNALKLWTVPYREIKTTFEDVRSLLPEAEELGDGELVGELIRNLDDIEKKLNELEVRKMLSGELDIRDCYLEINAGAGGTESCDWASMLSRMYQRWATKKGWKVEIIDRLDGEVAGIKNITFRFTGPFAYGYSKSEKGVHRLVRISPFDANARRHTSFASVDVTPIVEDVQIDVRPEDLKVDTYRASGAGGQHVNKTDSAVRMTHIPSGIVVSCQSERSQIQNRETCMKMLRSKLYEKEHEEQKKKLSSMGGEKKEIAWGSQIRNYVFQPYTLVKDTRTKYEVGNVQAVMDGEIDDFITAYLKEFG